MLRRTLFAAVLAGIVAGLLMTAIQHFKVTPLILLAETFENPSTDGMAKTVGELARQASEGHTHGDAALQVWAPSDGIERTFYSSLANVLAGVAYGLLLSGAAVLTSLNLTASNGAIWGLCGFLAFNLAPSAGLPPELPGMAAAELSSRQIWWWLTVAATAGGIMLFVNSGWFVFRAAAVVIAALPHIIGAPSANMLEASVPAGLAAEFVAITLASAAVFWMMLGTSLGYLRDGMLKHRRVR